ncbi:hypothetical protein ACFQY5_31080 [Paeniroseomonas aquatica]|uniref:hypothetical protein n=1 Tax=Paeniroseomonas aquatica TaxID=373043 RepID=UPI00361E2AE1
MPAAWTPAVGPARPRGLCTDCGISRSAEPKACGRACQFIRPDYPRLELQVHGRARDPARPDEVFFGPFRRMLRASLAAPAPGRNGPASPPASPNACWRPGRWMRC